ncbi:non-ribosomal peptide synthetase [Bacillus velezensis]|uniref:non-ribosomal peptide synthetase n=1 Tax=Bacillus velezensis TaxID=492670 RepID=UPI0022B98796|nr:non-ribosomal peptide synthetase [Bacillus velezensis]
MTKSIKGDKNSIGELKTEEHFLVGSKSSKEKRMKNLTYKLSQQLSDKLNVCCNGSDERLHVVLTAALTLLINQYTERQNIVIKTPVFRKNRTIDSEQEILTLKNAVHGEDLLKEIIHKVEFTVEQALESPQNNSRTSDKMTGLPFDVMIVLENIQEYILNQENPAIHILFSFINQKQYIETAIHYNECLYSQNMIKDLSLRFQMILEAMITPENIRVKDMRFLKEKNKQKKIFGWEDNYSKIGTISEVFEQQADEYSDKTALVLENSSMCYAELNHRANQLARYLQECGVKRGDLVGIALERSFDLYISILAILKSGGAYVPLDPQYPKQRLSFLIEDSGVELLITNESIQSQLPPHGDGVICLDGMKEEIEKMDGSNIGIKGSLDDLAYVMYTSGSTGLPKGVSIVNRGVIRLVKETDYAVFDENQTFLQLASAAFDASTFEIWGCLLNGGCLAIMPPGIPTADDIAEAVKKYNITTLWLTAGLFSLVVDQQLESLKGLQQLLVGGDVVSVPHVQKVLALGKVQVINGYGPTEGTTFTCCFPVPHDWKGSTLPIGRPISGTEIFILDSQLKPVAPGIPGELFIGGDGLAREYWRRPDLTKERFISHPFNNDPSARLYKTGDLVRYLENGDVEFIGRRDEQVKIRGFRIELGEIEARLINHTEIKEAAVTVNHNGDDDLYICAYYTSNHKIAKIELQHFLRDFLPEYMVPSYFKQMDNMPLTVNGKIDRRALPRPDISQMSETKYEAPTNETEKKLSEIWEAVLGRERVGIDENFFEIGGHSLKASMLISRIRKTFGTDIKVKELFEQPTIKQLSRLIQKRDKQNYPVISKARKQSSYQASSAQKRMFALWETDKDSIVYNLPIMIELNGKLDVKKAESVLQEIIGRHEALRTSFDVVSGDVVQIIHDTWELEFNYQKLPSDGIRPYVKQFIRPFHLDKAPLIRAGLITYEDRNLLLLDVHHIAADGVSVGIIRKEFNALYADHKLKQPPLQYKDYSEWQVSSGTKEALKEQEEYWLKRLSGDLPILNLQTDYERPRVKSFEGSRVSFTADERLTSSLKSVAKETGTTLYMVLLAVYNIMLSKYSGQQDVIIGTAESGRSDTELENTVGMFVNTVAIRNFPEEHKTFRAFLEEVKHHTLKDFENTDYQFENIVQKLGVKRDSSRNPLFDVMFTFESKDYGFGGNEETAESNLLVSEVNISRFDLTLTAMETDEGVNFQLEYCNHLFRKDTVERMGAHYTRLLQQVVSEPDTAICRLNMITDDEKHKLLYVFNDTAADFPHNKTIHQLFEEQAEKTPERIAAVYENNKVTYKELNERSNSLARILMKMGVKKESIVGIVADKSLEMVLGILGVLKAGGAFLPIDPGYPSERIKYMIEDSGSDILLVQNSQADNIPFDGKVIDLTDSSLYTGDRHNLPMMSSAEHLAYVIYTSGTTGKPKGVTIRHIGISNLKSVFEHDMNINYRDKIIQFASFSFDASVWEISMALLTGAELHILSSQVINNYTLFEEYINRHDITVATLPPVYINHININGLSALRLLITAGSQISTKSLNRIVNKIDYINAYGPTETTICSTMWRYSEAERAMAKTIPIGKPIRNLKAFIIDHNNNLVPIGLAGELCVSGDSLARGYLNKEKMTREKFIDHPFESGTKMYRTGDLARWLPDGNIEFLGRIDNQVKIRGFRIETDEIESQLLKISGIKEAVVIDKCDLHGDKYLSAFVTAEYKISGAALREQLGDILPQYMIPGVIIQVEQLPLTPNGKIDRKALAEIEEPKHIKEHLEAPRSEVEQILVNVWSEVLKIDDIGINDNYYELGGDSIKSILIVSKLQKYSLSLEVKDLLQYPQIKNLSKHVKLYKAQTDQSPVSGRTELAPIQKWFIENDFADIHHFNQAFMFQVKEKINEHALAKTFELLVKHHDALRLIYTAENDEIKQEVRDVQAARDTFTLDIYDLLADTDYKNTIEKLADQLQSGMDLEKGLLMKLGLFRTMRGDYLLIAIHHMVIDGVSWRILLEDMEQVYNNLQKGEPAVLPPKTASFQEWTRKLAEYANGSEIRKELRYWENIEKTKIKEIPRDFNKTDSVFKESRTITVSLTKQLTDKLQRNTNAAYNTQINDILLCSLGMAVKEWAGLDKVLIGLEGHGRENILENISIERTIGWFTSLFPIVLDMEHSDDLPYCIKNTKEYLRRIPHKGIGYGIIKYLTAPAHKKDISFTIKPEIGFNYLGEISQKKRAVFQHADISSGTSVSLSNKKLNAIEINSFIMDGQLQLEFNYSTKEFKEETIKTLTESYINRLIDIIQHCGMKKIPEKTPFDYGDLDLSIGDLEQILSSGKEIEKIHSLTPMQSGMLYHALLDPFSQAYFEQLTFSLSGQLDIGRLNTAFNMLIEKYEILRTCFFHEGLSKFKQAVLRERKVKIEFEDISTFSEYQKKVRLKNVQFKDRGTRFDLTNDCLIRVTVLKTDEKEYKLLFSFHHIIMDGWCMSLIMNDIKTIYTSLKEGRETVLQHTEPYSTYLEWLDNQDKSAALEYWGDYLNEYEQQAGIPKFC